MAAPWVTIGSTELAYVTHIVPTYRMSPTAFIQSDGEGAGSTSVEVHGYILGTAASLLTQQQALVDALRGEGDCVIDIVNLTNFTGRVTEISWDRYNSGPLWRYTLQIAPGTGVNPYLGTISVGALTLNNPTPAVVETWAAPSVDDPMDKTHQRGFEITGTYVGTPAAMETFLNSLEDEITPGGAVDAEGYLTLVTPMGSFSAKCMRKRITRPSGTSSPEEGITYSLSFETRKDFTLEQWNLGHSPVSVGGQIWDIVNSFTHSIQSQLIDQGPARKITGESMSWSLTKWFDSVAQAEAFKATIDQLIVLGSTMASPSGQLLRINNLSYNVVTRDGNAGDDARRYALTASVTYSKDTSQRVNSGGTHFGIVFAEITSISESVSLDENGGITSRTKTVSGKVATYPSGIIGNSYTEVNGKTYYVTNTSGGAIDEDGLYGLSVTGRTLDSAEQAASLVTALFSTLFLNDVTSQNRSVSHSEIGDTGILELTSLTESITGYVWGGDRAAILNMVTAVNATYGSDIITNVSVGRREPYTRPDTMSLSYRESVSMTRTVSYDPTEPEEEEDTTPDEGGGSTAPAVRTETSVSISDQVPQWRPITIPGRGIVMKKVGVVPKKATIRVTNTARDWTKFATMSPPPDPSDPVGGIKTNRQTGSDGLTKWVEISWTRESAE